MAWNSGGKLGIFFPYLKFYVYGFRRQKIVQGVLHITTCTTYFFLYSCLPTISSQLRKKSQVTNLSRFKLYICVFSLASVLCPVICLTK